MTPASRAAATGWCSAVPEPLVRTRFNVAAGACLDCAGDLAGQLRALPGVKAVHLLTAANAVLVEHEQTVPLVRIQEGAAHVGVHLVPAGTEHGAPKRWWRQPTLIALAIAATLLIVGLLIERVIGRPSIAMFVYFAALIAGGLFPARGAIGALRTGRLTISTLLVAAAVGALALGVYEEAALLVVVFSLGEVLEAYASARARGAIRGLMQLAPRVARRRGANGVLDEVPVEALTPDEHIVVRPGERIPTDGTVVSGSSAVDQSPITGESIPVEVTGGSTVFGGTINGTGALDVRVTKPYAETTLARIIRQVEEAQASKGRAERFADRFGAVYTPAMFVLAVIVATVPPLMGGNGREWLYRALVVLTVSCSCALVISVPVSVVAAIARAARSGILIKGGVYLETLGRVRAVAFDKTGTLTEGRPHLTDVMPLGDWSAQDALSVAARVEAASEHPLAAAIINAATQRGIVVTPGHQARAIAGAGIEASIDGERWFIGKPRAPLPPAAKRELAQRQREGKTAVVLSDGAGRARAILAIADTPRSQASHVVHALHALGVTPIIMLTGDNEQTAAAVAGAVGIDQWRAGLLPEDKARAVLELRARHGTVAMIGDGVNDAPGLAVADVGIAMGAAGTDVALETADVALMADDLEKLPEAIRLARLALANIRQNITLSLASVVVLVIGALAGWFSLTTGLLLNEGSALLIIANGLRLVASRDTGHQGGQVGEQVACAA